MKIGRAVVVFADIENEGFSDHEKALAIHKVINMETHNGIKKRLDAMRNPLAVESAIRN